MQFFHFNDGSEALTYSTKSVQPYDHELFFTKFGRKVNRKNLSSTQTAALYFYMLACGLPVK